MHEESRLGRFLWTVVLSAVVALVIASFARHPLLGADGTASGFARPLTLWVAGSDADGQAQAVARLAAGRWGIGDRLATVQTLPGGSSTAVADFLDHVRGGTGGSENLLVITSTTLAELAGERRDALHPEAQSSARRALALLGEAAPIAVLSGDPLALAVSSRSQVGGVEALPWQRRQSVAPLFGVADDPWQTANLAALAGSSNLAGRLPYDVFPSARQALLGVDSGAVEVALAPRSAIGGELRRGGLRALPWPRRDGGAPRAWVAVVAPLGLSSGLLARLRHEARQLTASAAWRRVLRHEGLEPITLTPARLRGFVRANIRDATRLQTIAERVLSD